VAERGMGRGLAAILPLTPAPSDELRDLAVEAIEPNPDQPRTRFDDEALEGLAASIAESGVIQPLIVRPLPSGSFELIAGERRWRAAQKAGLAKVPAIIRDSDEAERMQTALIENMVREDLNPVEEARACTTLVEDLAISKEELARRVGRSRPAISNLIRLLDLPDDALALLEDGSLSEGHGRAVLGVKGHDARSALARDAARGGWSVRETERRAQLASEPRRNGRRTHVRTLSSEERAAMAELGDRFETATGHGAEIKPTSAGIRVELELESIEQASELLAKIERSG
jgi:ParB family transcriptional regulator, chromosome partitioning protein